MARDGGYEIVEVGQVIPDKAMRLKSLQIKTQEAKNKIALAKQGIENLKNGEIAKFEYTILHAEAELKQYIEHEKKIQSSVDTQQSK
jgi:hypothetical protein